MLNKITHVINQTVRPLLFIEYLTSTEICRLLMNLINKTYLSITCGNYAANVVDICTYHM